jgi:hypothetical protein
MTNDLRCALHHPPAAAAVIRQLSFVIGEVIGAAA